MAQGAAVFTRRQTIHAALAVAAMPVLCGCGPSAEVRPELYAAHGTLTINGKPAEGAMLVLHPAEDKPFDSRGTRPKAVVQADGSFDLMTYQAADGAPLGDYDVAILWFANPDSNAPWDKLGGRLANPNQTHIRITVAEGRAELEPIELDGVRVLTRRPPSRTRDLDQVD